VTCVDESRIHHQKYMCDGSTFAHSRSSKLRTSEGTGAHNLSGDAIRAAETAQMLPHTKLMVNWVNLRSVGIDNA